MARDAAEPGTRRGAGTVDGMAGVTGIGGVFFKCADPAALTAWYAEHLGLPVDDDGYVVLRWGGDHAGSTVWGPFPQDTTTFGWPAGRQWVINYRVDDLDALLERLRAADVDVSDEMFDDDSNGRFAHCWDPEGNLVQLWQPRPGM